MTLSDIVEELKQDPEATLTKTITENRQALRRMIASRMDQRLRGRVDPSDIIQETLMEAHKRLGEYLENPTLPFLTWLFVLAEQNTISAYRRHIATKKRTTEREHANYFDEPSEDAEGEVVICDLTGPAQMAEKLDRMVQLHKAISMLSPQAQTIVRMRFLEERSLAEIAEVLGISVDAVSKRAMRSLVKLSAYASELGLGETP